MRASRSKPQRGKRRAAANDPFVGRDVIGQYRIVDKLGSGGMGAVYLAEQMSIGRRAVIKVLHPRLQGSDTQARFAIEAKAASQLEHPNVVTIYNYGAMDDGALFLAMELLEGETLAEVLKSRRGGRLPIARAIPIALQIANALASAHRRGVVHRDLKPSNIMLVERAGMQDFVKVLDFGIAKLEGAGVTSTGEVFGTPRYMSPEQLRGGKVDGRADQYALGLLVYEMLAGRSPFASDTPQGWMYMHVSEAPPPPTAVAKKLALSPALESVILRALAKSPADRFASVEEFARELDAAARAPVDASASAPAKPKKAKKSLLASMPWTRPPPVAPPSRWQRALAIVATTRRRVIAASIGAALVIAIIVVALSSGSAGSAAAATSPSASLVDAPVATPAPAESAGSGSGSGSATKRTVKKGKSTKPSGGKP